MNFFLNIEKIEDLSVKKMKNSFRTFKKEKMRSFIFKDNSCHFLRLYFLLFPLTWIGTLVIFVWLEREREKATWRKKQWEPKEEKKIVNKGENERICEESPMMVLLFALLLLLIATFDDF